MMLFLKLIRVNQWSKNILLFFPLTFSHQFANQENLFLNCIMFIAFSLCASATYIVNDIIDLESDKKHPYKKFRPLASNRIKLSQAIMILISLIILSLVILSFIKFNGFILIIFYILGSFLYSIFLKKIIYIDCIILSFFYIYRIYIGSYILKIDLSLWLLSFSYMFFLSLAFLKRYGELYLHKNLNQLKNYRRQYKFNKDINLIRLFGYLSGIMSCLILIFYAQSESSKILYDNSNFIIFAGLILFTWLLRIWNKAKNENMNDPIEFVIRDIFTYFCFVLIVIILLFAKLY